MDNNEDWYILIYMTKMYKRTTIWLPIVIHTQAKMMALLTDSSFSDLLRIALLKEIKYLKAQNDKKNTYKIK